MAQQPANSRPGGSGKDIYTTLKFLVLLICVIPTLQKCFEVFSSDEVLFFNIAKMAVFFVVISLTATFWFIINYAFKNERVRKFFEVTVMYGVCLLCYVSTGAALSNYKFIFATYYIQKEMPF